MASCWSDDETLWLISLWSEDRIQAMLEGSRKNRKVFETIAREMGSAGYHRSPDQCSGSFRKPWTQYLGTNRPPSHQFLWSLNKQNQNLRRFQKMQMRSLPLAVATHLVEAAGVKLLLQMMTVKRVQMKWLQNVFKKAGKDTAQK
jgi:hypothetical protein